VELGQFRSEENVVAKEVNFSLGKRNFSFIDLLLISSDWPFIVLNLFNFSENTDGRTLPAGGSCDSEEEKWRADGGNQLLILHHIHNR
jgi:hypothetical protein